MGNCNATLFRYADWTLQMKWCCIKAVNFSTGSASMTEKEWFTCTHCNKVSFFRFVNVSVMVQQWAKIVMVKHTIFFLHTANNFTSKSLLSTLMLASA
jgi:hypothetical protein